MILDLPFYVYFTFALAVVLSLVLFYRASNKNTYFLVGIIIWGGIHSLLAISGFYDNTRTTPPRIVLVIFPMFAIVFSSIFSRKMRDWLASFNLQQLTYLHTIRIIVELVLFWLFIGKYAPEIITFEGRNFDILAGITAPIVAFFAFRNNRINTKILWVWHIFSIVLLVNILVHAVLSMPTIFQQFAFDQPNIAVAKFPFLLLPGIIVPIVLLSNIAGFVILLRMKKSW